MKIQAFLLPSVALGAAAVLLSPAMESHGFTTIGGNLSTDQRDVRVFNNFVDAVANNNVTPDAHFPGYDGAEAAFWRSGLEWGSGLHGDGGGDPHQPAGLGSGGANF